jgi:predicted nucleotide-binding protein (sugar kinase/HSP70/actin superfamily)
MNKILTDIAQGVTDKVPAQNKEQFDRVVLAGKKILFDPKFHQNMELVKNPESRKNPVDTISTGVAGLMELIYLQSNKKYSPNAVIMGGCILMCEVLDFVERAYGIQVTNELVAQTWKMTMDKVMRRLGITPEALQQAIQKGAKEIQDSKAGIAPQGQQTPQAGILGGQ